MRLVEIITFHNLSLYEQVGETSSQKQSRIPLENNDMVLLQNVILDVKKITDLASDFSIDQTTRTQITKIVASLNTLLTQRFVLFQSIVVFLGYFSLIYKIFVSLKDHKMIKSWNSYNNALATLKQIYNSFETKHRQYRQEQDSTHDPSQAQKQIEKYQLSAKEYRILNNLAKEQGMRDLKYVVMFFNFLYKNKTRTPRQLADVYVRTQIQENDINKADQGTAMKDAERKAQDPKESEEMKIYIIKNISAETIDIVQKMTQQKQTQSPKSGDTRAAVTVQKHERPKESSRILLPPYYK